MHSGVIQLTGIWHCQLATLLKPTPMWTAAARLLLLLSTLLLNLLLLLLLSSHAQLRSSHCGGANEA